MRPARFCPVQVSIWALPRYHIIAIALEKSSPCGNYPFMQNEWQLEIHNSRFSVIVIAAMGTDQGSEFLR